MLIVGMAGMALASPSRYIIDDDAYSDRVIEAGAKLLKAGKLCSADALRQQVHTRGYPVRLAPLTDRQLEAPDLFDRVRESTLAVGTFYKCKDCKDWHFNSSAGFVVAEGGIVCTCCHVITARDKAVTESYLVAADAHGNVFPIRSVLAADTDSDTCFLKVEASGLKPLPVRSGVRTGERVYCLSHPGGYYFMFTQGMVARLNRRANETFDDQDQATGELTRPVLYLNVTAEFAPGSSGGPLVDEAGNVVGQVASIADAGEPDLGDDDFPASPSVPVRFGTAAEEILRLADPKLAAHAKPKNSPTPAPRPKNHPAPPDEKSIHPKAKTEFRTSPRPAAHD